MPRPSQLNTKVPCHILAAYFGNHQSVITNHIRKGTRLDNVYIVLNQPESVLSDQRKKWWLEEQSLTEVMKSRIWQKYLAKKGK